MGRQSSRIYWQGKDHKEMVVWDGSKFQYHDKAYIWNGSSFELVWEKLKYTVIADKIDGLEFEKFVPYETENYYVGFYYYNDFSSPPHTEFPFNTLIRIDKKTYQKEALITTDNTRFGGFVDSKIFLFNNYTYKHPYSTALIYDVENKTIIMNKRDSALSISDDVDFGIITHKNSVENNGIIYSLCDGVLTKQSATRHYAAVLVGNPNQMSYGTHASIMPICSKTGQDYVVAQSISGVEFFAIDGSGLYLAILRDFGDHAEIISERSIVDLVGESPTYYYDWYFDNGFIILQPDIWAGLYGNSFVLDLRQMKVIKKLSLENICKQTHTGGRWLRTHPKIAEYCWNTPRQLSKYIKYYDDTDEDEWKQIIFNPSISDAKGELCYMNDGVFFVESFVFDPVYGNRSVWQGYKFRKKEDE